jgi:hypothetical protein
LRVVRGDDDGDFHGVGQWAKNRAISTGSRLIMSEYL